MRASGLYQYLISFIELMLGLYFHTHHEGWACIHLVISLQDETRKELQRPYDWILDRYRIPIAIIQLPICKSSHLYNACGKRVPSKSIESSCAPVCIENQPNQAGINHPGR